MTHDIRTEAAREAARQDNGQFGTQPRSEADVDLTPSANNGTVIDALRHAGFDGPIEDNAPGRLTYTDTDDGANYDIDVIDGSFQIRSEDTDAFGLVMSFNQQPPAPDKVAEQLREVIRSAGETCTFAAAADKWASTPGDDRSHGWADHTLDAGSGVLSGDGWAIEGFTTRMGHYDDTEMLVKISDPDLDDGLTFHYCRTRNDETRIFRGDSADQPLTRWEEEALDGRLMTLMRRDGYVRSVRELFNSVVRDNEKREARR